MKTLKIAFFSFTTLIFFTEFINIIIGFILCLDYAHSQLFDTIFAINTGLLIIPFTVFAIFSTIKSVEEEREVCQENGFNANTGVPTIKKES